MGLKTFKPTSPAQRHLVLVDRSELWSGKPEKSLTEGRNEKGGRNNKGRITARRQAQMGLRQQVAQLGVLATEFDVGRGQPQRDGGQQAGAYQRDTRSARRT